MDISVKGNQLEKIFNVRGNVINKGLSTSLHKMFFEQCVKKYGSELVVIKQYPNVLVMGHTKDKFPSWQACTVSVTIIDKYTIVELGCNGKVRQGLATIAPCDGNGSVMAGIGIAYDRAFEKMTGVDVVKTRPIQNLTVIIDNINEIVSEAFNDVKTHMTKNDREPEKSYFSAGERISNEDLHQNELYQKLFHA
ncbi:MAG: hypothetical protein KAS32_02285 [Candidatus Peribacteraceae bacterium]|nr:hypothetical protein [Candidatus Peribacteraceae bacterium]